MRTERLHLGLLWVTLAVVAGVARGQVILDEPPERAQGLEVDQRLGERVPLDLELVTAEGEPVTLGEYFDGERPVVLVMGYYDCPLLCTLVFDGTARSLADVSFDAGEDYQVVVVSFDPTNTTEQALERKQTALSVYGRPVTPRVRAGWAFHTTTDENARALADALGYRYRYVEENGEYAHGAVIMLLTPEGVLSRYLAPDEARFGFSERNLRKGLLEASDGGIARSAGDLFLHYCYSWDPSSDSYALAAFKVMRIGAVIGAVALGGLIAWLKLGERRRAAREHEGTHDAAAHGAPAMGRT